MMQEGTDNMEHEINALRMEIDNISSQQDNNVDDDVSYVYYEQEALDRDINATPLLLLTGPEKDSTGENQNENENRNEDYNGNNDESEHPETSREMREANLRNALRINKEYQDFLNIQLRNIEMELQKNQELQKRYRVAIAQKEKPPTKRNQNNTTKRVPGNPYFIDQEGARPPDNNDTIELKPELEKTALVYRFKKWSKAEVTSLAQAIRKQNSEHQFEKLLKELETGRITHERFDAEHAAIRRISDAELEANVDDIDWDEVASVVGSSRSAADCMIAWTNSESSAVNKSAWTKEEDTQLVKIAKKYRGFQWQAVARELGTRRAPVQCLRRYQRNLNTNIMKTSWTPEEDLVLAESVKKFGVGNWQQVANYLVGRTGQQCLHRWDKTLRPTIKKGRWNAEEDKKLLEAVELVGSTKSWIKISQYVPGRTDMQCRERYVNVLNPDLKRNTWTPDEDTLLQQAIAIFGLGKWSQVAGVVRSRTDNQCWRRWKSLNPDVVDNYREAIGKKKSKKKAAKNSETPPTPDEPDDQELKRVAKRRKTDSKNSRKSNKALSDGIQSAKEPEELIRVFAQENTAPPPPPPPAPQSDTQFNVTLEPTPAKVRGRPKRNRVSWPQPRVVATSAAQAIPAMPTSPISPAIPAVPASPASPPAFPAFPASPAFPTSPASPTPPTPSVSSAPPPPAPHATLTQASIPLVQPKAPASPALHAVSAYHALVAPPESPIFNVVPQSRELIVIPSTPPPPPRAHAKIPAQPAQAVAKTPAQPVQAIAKTPARTPISARRINKRRIIQEESEEEESDGDTSADSNFEDEDDEEEEEEDGGGEVEEESEEEVSDGEKKTKRRGKPIENTLPVVFPSPALYVALYRLFDSLEQCKTSTNNGNTNNSNEENSNNRTSINSNNNDENNNMSLLVDSFKKNPEFKLLAAWFNSLFLCSLLVVKEAKENTEEEEQRDK